MCPFSTRAGAVNFILPRKILACSEGSERIQLRLKCKMNRSGEDKGGLVSIVTVWRWMGCCCHYYQIVAKTTKKMAQTNPMRTAEAETASGTVLRCALGRTNHLSAVQVNIDIEA
jgi:hypothetical protein